MAFQRVFAGGVEHLPQAAERVHPHGGPKQHKHDAARQRPQRDHARSSPQGLAARRVGAFSGAFAVLDGDNPRSHGQQRHEGQQEECGRAGEPGQACSRCRHEQQPETPLSKIGQECD